MRSRSPAHGARRGLGIEQVVDPAEVGICPVGIIHPRPIDEEANRVIGLLARGLGDRRGEAVGGSTFAAQGVRVVRLIKRARKVERLDQQQCPAPSARAMPSAQALIAAQSPPAAWTFA